MKLKKINSEDVIDIEIKNVRLPKENECSLIVQYSFLFLKGNYNIHFFKEFINDFDEYDENIDDFEACSAYNPVYGDFINETDCVDLIPVIEINDEVEPYIIYIDNKNIPFMSINKNTLLCLSRIDYISDCDYSDEDNYNDICAFIEDKLEWMSKNQ